MDKVVRNGKVAVIVSPGYGAGWSTWHSDPDSAAFSPKIVNWIESGKVGDPPVEDGEYPGGLANAEVRWLDQGTQFRIHEYDGSEGLEIYSPSHYIIA